MNNQPENGFSPCAQPLHVRDCLIGGHGSEPASFGRPRGFVLVSVLLIVALATILVVVASMMAQIERKAAANGAKIEQARANALFALDLAVNQLQREAGPDQRVTARAEILDTNSTTLNTNTVKQPLWTGVWKTWTNQPATNMLDVGSSPQRTASLGSLSPTIAQKVAKAAWLVSGTNASYDPTTFTGVTTGTNADAAVLAKNLGTNAISVTVPLVPVTVISGSKTTTNGAYAYWVSDEGVKAKANIKDPTYGVSSTANSTTYIINQQHFLTSQAVPVNAGLIGSNNTTDVRNQADLAKVATLQSLGFVTGVNASSLAGTNAATYLPDATTYSYGVLADVRNGGLKKDLTAAFEDDLTVNPSGQYNALRAASGSGSGFDAQCVYRSTSTFGAVPPLAGSAMDGLRWRSLYFYYNLFKNTMPLNRAKVSTRPSNSGIQGSALGFSGGPYALSVRAPIDGDDGAATGGFLEDPIMPRVIQARIDIALCSFVDPVTGNYRLRLRYYPMIVLWNPFSVRITSATNYGINFTGNFFLRSDAKIQVGGAYALGGANSTVNLGGGVPELKTLDSDTVTFEPGEIKMFALKSDAAMTSTTATKFTLVSSDSNISADWAQYYDLPWAGTSNGADLVIVTCPTTIQSNGIRAALTSNGTNSNNSLNTWPDSNTLVKVESGVNPIASFVSPTDSVNGTWTPCPISSMNGTPYLLVGYNYREKGIKPTADPSYSSAAYNPPMYMGNASSFNLLNTAYGSYWRELYARCFRVYSSVTEVQSDNPGVGTTHHTSWGDSSVGVDSPNSVNSRRVLVDIPVQPLFSIGQFQHLFPSYSHGSSTYNNIYQTFATRFIGGSLASPNVSLDQTTNQGDGSVLMDHSFMANQALFDGYYFSTVPPANQAAADAAKYMMVSSSLASAIQNDNSLPNNRMRFYRKNGIAPAAADLRDLKKAAANLMVDGAFNVNSTSVNAWRALLSSLSGNDIKLWNSSANSTATLIQSTLQNPIPRFWTSSNSGAVNQPWEGMRALSDAEVTQLATQIVQQVKTRGPFLSMADFLNRRLAPTATIKSQLYTMGALQAAIDTTSPDINATAKTAGTTVTMNPAVNGDPFGVNYYGASTSLCGMYGAAPASGYTTALTSANTSLPTNTATGIPGYLTQQDLVQAFAPVMTVRSDTFVVRCYGESINPKTLAKEGQAWGEAVVQRVPDFVDQSDSSLAALGDASPVASVNPANQTFGRRFKIVSFRWLNETDL